MSKFAAILGRLLLGLAVMTLGTGVLPAGADVGGNPLAVFTEFSPDSKPMTGGWNRRVFTDCDVQKGGGIECDFATGIITLAPGSYHLTGMSMVTYNSGGEPAEMATVRAPASAGYCRLRIFDPQATADSIQLRGVENSDPSIICIGSPSTANLAPSLFETYFTNDKPTQIILEHQSGSSPDHIYLRVYLQNSKWHVMARISIQRI